MALTRKGLIIAAKESTYGTDATPAGTDAIKVANINITPLQSDVVARQIIRPFLGNPEQLLANQRVELTFDVELTGSGAAGTYPAYGILIEACGFNVATVAATSVTYTPLSATFPSATLYYFNDGIRHKLTGARGSFSLTAEVGQIPTLSFTFMGIYNAPGDVTPPSTTYNDQADPVIFKAGNTSGFQLFSYAGCLQSVNMDLSNEMVYRELINCAKQVMITNRAPNGTVVIEAPNIADHDYFADAIGSDTGNLIFQHGQTAGNIVTFSSPQTDLGSPTYSDQDGVQMLNLPFIATPTDAGNDELEIEFT
jgi:hypothetical protein